MKAERRHELKESDLAKWVADARVFLVENRGHLTTAAIVVVAVLALGVFLTRSRTATREDSWRRRNLLSFETYEGGRTSLQSLISLTRESSDDDFVLRALADTGTQALRLARMAPNPPDRDLNEKARTAFGELLSRFKENPLAFGAAHSGLATVEENAFVLDSNPSRKEQARAHLTAMIDHQAMNGLPFQKSAIDRRKTLDELFIKVTFAPAPPPEPTEPMESATEGAPPAESSELAPPPTSPLAPNTTP